MEARADAFAFQHMPDVAKTWGHMATNYIIQQLVAIAKQRAGTADDEHSPIKISDREFGHPNMLLRAYSLKAATGAVDFLLEQYEQETVIDGAGTWFPGICSLAQE
jgi:hypothetical protein